MSSNNIKLIAGPCVIESAELLDSVALVLVRCYRELNSVFIF